VATAHEFFDYIVKQAAPLPTLQEVVLKTNPGLEVLLKTLGDRVSGGRRKDIQEFYSCFRPIRLQPRNTAYTSFFLYGSEPQWEDIFNDYDAPRDFTSEVIQIVGDSLKSKEVRLIAIAGSAGSGKSTTLKRIAIQLSSIGTPVFFTSSDQLPALHHFEHALDLLPGPSVLIFDNATLATSILPDYLSAAKRASLKHIFIIAGRANKLTERLPLIKSVVEVKEFPMPDLSSNDIDSIISLLERTHMLGKLANMPQTQQRQVFLSYAHNQILVAMRRATLGHGFDDIIKHEFLTAEPVEAQMLYLCASIVTDAQSPISKQQLLGCVNLSPSETLQLIQENLRGILIPIPSNPHYYMARHRVIAQLIVEQFAPRQMLKEAYINLLKVIAHDLPVGTNASSAIVRLYRRIINHTTIYNRFSEHLKEARTIYSSLTKSFSRDHHFWLQFGSLELEYGELDNAANYIEQAHKYAPDDALVVTTRAHLRYKQSINANLLESARVLREEAREILRAQMVARAQDIYPYHVYCTQELAWINHWLHTNKEKIKALEELRAFAKQIVETHTFSPRLKEISTQIHNAYLDLAKPDTSSGSQFNPVIK
jgi:tetratricopeptide (TPR) repeat protein